MVQINLIGRLGADATSEEFTEFGRFALRFDVCSNVRKKDKDGSYFDLPQWYKVTYFVKSTALMPYLKKGTNVFVGGDLLIDSYLSQNTGNTVCSAQITASRVELLGSKEDNTQQNN